MRNWKTFLIVAFFITGFAIEMFKTAQPRKPQRPAEPDLIATEVAKNMVDELGYDIDSAEIEENETVKDIHKKAKKFRFKRKGGNDWFPNAGAEADAKKAFKHGKKIKKAKKKLKKNGKKIVRKKKKEKPKVEDGGSPVIAQKKPEPETKPENTDKPANTATNTGGVGPQNQANANADKKEKTLEEWERILFNRPSFSETRKFIEERRLGNVSKDIYYKIAEKMLADSRVEMHDLAVRVYGQLQTAEGFTGLADIVNGDFAFTTKEFARKHYPLYQSVENLKILNQVISTDSASHVKKEAISNIQASVQENIKGIGAGELIVRSADGVTFKNPVSQAYAELYRSLNALTFRTQDAELIRLAQDELARLQFQFNINRAGFKAATN